MTEYEIYFDNDGAPYIIIPPFGMPANAYAEIEDGTYGELQGWRIYLRCAVEYDNDRNPVIYPK